MKTAASAPTLRELFVEFQAQHVCEAATARNVEQRMKYALDTFGDVRLSALSLTSLRAWRATLPARDGYRIVKVLRQVLNYAVEVGIVDENRAKSIPNPKPKRAAILPFASLAEVFAVADELPTAERLMPILGCTCGLRPQELLGLHRASIDVKARLLYVRWTVGKDGGVREYGKTSGSLRAVPLTNVAVEAIEAHPVRMDSLLLFPSQRNRGNVAKDLHWWRGRHWTPALAAAGLTHGVHTPCGTRSRPGLSLPVSPRSCWPGRWAPAWK